MELIESLTKQKYKGKEMIVVDDASTDGTIDVLRQKHHVRDIRAELNVEKMRAAQGRRHSD